MKYNLVRRLPKLGEIIVSDSNAYVVVGYTGVEDIVTLTLGRCLFNTDLGIFNEETSIQYLDSMITWLISKPYSKDIHNFYIHHVVYTSFKKGNEQGHIEWCWTVDNYVYSKPKKILKWYTASKFICNSELEELCDLNKCIHDKHELERSKILERERAKKNGDILHENELVVGTFYKGFVQGRSIDYEGDYYYLYLGKSEKSGEYLFIKFEDSGIRRVVADITNNRKIELNYVGLYFKYYKRVPLMMRCDGSLARSFVLSDFSYDSTIRLKEIESWHVMHDNFYSK